MTKATSLAQNDKYFCTLVNQVVHLTASLIIILGVIINICLKKV